MIGPRQRWILDTFNSVSGELAELTHLELQLSYVDRRLRPVSFSTLAATRFPSRFCSYSTDLTSTLLMSQRGWTAQPTLIRVHRGLSINAAAG